MTYLEIKKLLEDNYLNCSISLDVASCVMASLPRKIRDKTFTIICDYVRHIWDKVDKTYTQLIADIVVDDLYNCFEYYNRVPLTLKDLENHTKDDQVINQYYDKYYD